MSTLDAGANPSHILHIVLERHQEEAGKARSVGKYYAHEPNKAMRPLTQIISIYQSWQ